MYSTNTTSPSSPVYYFFSATTFSKCCKMLQNRKTKTTGVPVRSSTSQVHSLVSKEGREKLCPVVQPVKQTYKHKERTMCCQQKEIETSHGTPVEHLIQIPSICRDMHLDIPLQSKVKNFLSGNNGISAFNRL